MADIIMDQQLKTAKTVGIRQNGSTPPLGKASSVWTYWLSLETYCRFGRKHNVSTMYNDIYCILFVVESLSMFTFRLSSAFDALSAASALAATIFALT
jgi:hypothetical protein